jgi:hypothetical protein
MKRVPLLGVCLLLLCGVREGWAQEVIASTNPARKGSGDLTVAVQSYYDRVNGTDVANVQGTAVSLRQFFPRSGLFTLELEPVTRGGRFALGENYALWTGLPWMNRHWDFAAGDFRTATSLVEAPFSSLAQPEVALRGAKVTARSDHWVSSVYAGTETLSQGDRVPYRIRVPQSALGAESIAKLGLISLGIRYLHLSSSPESVEGNKLFFPANRAFTASDTLTTQLDWKLTKALNWYSEGGWSHVSPLAGTPGNRSQLSYVAGPALHAAHFVMRANYLSQGTGYLPLPGYYLGDRRGANVDGFWSLGRLSLNGNWNQMRNNREHDPSVPDYYSQQGGGGAQLRLPGNVFLSGSTSRLHFETRSTENGLVLNDSRLYLLMVARPIGHHNLHASWQRVDSTLQQKGQQLEFLEVEDNYTWRRFSGGGAARWQRAASDQLRQSLFWRASGQLQLRHLSLYGYWEQGRDLANQTLFATQVSSTSVVGMTWDTAGGFTVRGEAFRNHLNSVLNPESLFVLGSQGIIPDSILGRSDDWSLFLRLSRQFSWGEPGRLGGPGLNRPEAPLTGTLAGFVKLHTLAGDLGAGDVWLVADTGQAVKTDANGYFQMPEVVQGPRVVRIDLDRLPADLNPPEKQEWTVDVHSGQLSRIDLAVTPLEALEGDVTGADGEPAAEGIALELLPTGAYTSTDSDGRFGFYNLPEGDYEIRVLDSTLPENAKLVSPSPVRAQVRYGKTPAPVEFQYAIVLPGPKPAKKVLTERQQRVVPSARPSPKPKQSAGQARRRVIVRTTAENTMPVSATAARNSLSVESSSASPVNAAARWVAR